MEAKLDGTENDLVKTRVNLRTQQTRLFVFPLKSHLSALWPGL